MNIENPIRKEKQQPEEGLCPKCEQPLSGGICNNEDCKSGGAIETFKVIRDKEGKEEPCPGCREPLYTPGRICLNKGKCLLADNEYSVERDLEEEVKEFLAESKHREK